jgi:hypothetical protein
VSEEAMIQAGKCLGECIRILWGIQKSPSLTTTPDLDEIIKYLLEGMKIFGANAIGVIEQRSGPVEMPAACMDQDMFNQTIDLLMIFQRLIKSSFDYADLFRLLP